MSLPVSVVSTLTIHNYLSEPRNHIGVYFESSKKQKFFSYQKNHQFIHEKIDDTLFVIPDSVSEVHYNSTLPNFNNSTIQFRLFSNRSRCFRKCARMLSDLLFDEKSNSQPDFFIFEENCQT